jgi:hypothetical protein
MSYLDLARRALERRASQPEAEGKPVPAIRKPWNPTPEEEAAFCRVFEEVEGVPAGSMRLYTPEEFRRLFGPAKLFRKGNEWVRIPIE